MTGSVEREGSGLPLDGRVVRLGSESVLCCFRLPTSMPIPLAVVAPADLELLTWAFAGMKAPEQQPTCLLLLRPHSAAAASALSNGADLVLRTHFRDIAIVTAAAEGAESLSSGERVVMARAVLSSVTPPNVAALVDPITLLTRDMAPTPVPKTGPVLMIANDRSSSCTLSGTDVPNFILFESEAGIRCARVATACMTFSPKPLLDLELEPVWGPDIARPVRAILIGDGRFTPAHIRAVAA